VSRHLVAVACLATLALAPAMAEPDTDAVIKFGLVGVWAPDCTQPPSSSNIYVRFAIVNGRPTRAVQANGAYPVRTMRDVRIAAPDRLVYLLEVATGRTHRRTIARIGEAIRGQESIDAEGSTIIKDGKFVASGVPTLLYRRCSAQISTTAESTVRAMVVPTVDYEYGPT
jgi:hypothetical protein